MIGVQIVLGGIPHDVFFCSRHDPLLEGRYDAIYHDGDYFPQADTLRRSNWLALSLDKSSMSFYALASNGNESNRKTLIQAQAFKAAIQSYHKHSCTINEAAATLIFLDSAIISDKSLKCAIIEMPDTVDSDDLNRSAPAPRSEFSTFLQNYLRLLRNSAI